jgi:hypothetical protein
MIPTHALRLQSMLRSMIEVVVPAIGAEQQLARDQAAIIVANIRVLLDQHDKVYHFLLCELREYRDLLRALQVVSSSPDSAVKLLPKAEVVIEPWVTDLLEMALPAQRDLADAVSLLKQQADQWLEVLLASDDPALREQASALVLQQSGKQIERERSWLRSSGFDADVGSVPAIDILLGIQPNLPEAPKKGPVHVD